MLCPFFILLVPCACFWQWCLFCVVLIPCLFSIVLVSVFHFSDTGPLVYCVTESDDGHPRHEHGVCRVLPLHLLPHQPGPLGPAAAVSGGNPAPPPSPALITVVVQRQEVWCELIGEQCQPDWGTMPAVVCFCSGSCCVLSTDVVCWSVRGLGAWAGGARVTTTPLLHRELSASSCRCCRLWQD